MDDRQIDTIREIERLRVLADWYRGWALVSGSEQQRTSRLGIADDIDAEARALMRSLDGTKKSFDGTKKSASL